MLLFTHVSETLREVEEISNRYGLRPVEHLYDLGILDEDFVAVHAIHLDENEKKMIIDTGAKIVHCPECNMKLASGAAPAWDLVERGATLALGTDGPGSNNNLDLFEEMRSASLMSKLVTGDPEAMNATTVVRMATIDGARVLGLGQHIGTLEVGKLADLIIIVFVDRIWHQCTTPFRILFILQEDQMLDNVIVKRKNLCAGRARIYYEFDIKWTSGTS